MPRSRRWPAQERGSAHSSPAGQVEGPGEGLHRLRGLAEEHLVRGVRHYGLPELGGKDIGHVLGDRGEAAPVLAGRLREPLKEPGTGIAARPQEPPGLVHHHDPGSALATRDPAPDGIEGKERPRGLELPRGGP